MAIQIRRGLDANVGAFSPSAGEPFMTTDIVRMYLGGAAAAKHVMACKCNITATAAPTVNDDAGDGYSVNSFWCDTTNDKAYQCLDSTVGAAVWIEITAGAYSLAIGNAISGGTASYLLSIDATNSLLSTTAITTPGRNLIDDATVADQRTTLGLGSGDSPQFQSIELGHASDCTLQRISAGDIEIETNLIYRANGTDVPIGDGGTGASTAYAAKDALTVKGADVASATTTDLAAATGEYVDVTGTTTITGLGTAAAGVERVVRFTGILTLTHHATALILPGAANITTAANDRAFFRSLGSGNWICTAYTRASGAAITPGGVNLQDIDALADPGADRILGWDDSAGHVIYFSCGNGITTNGTELRGVVASETDVGVVELSTNAETQTGTDTGRVMTPASAHYHPGAVKAWIELDASSGTPTATKSKNITSITDHGTGAFTVVFDTDFDSANYTRIGVCMVTISAGGFCFGPVTDVPAAGSCRFVTTTAAFAAADCKYVSIVFLGGW